MREGGSVYGARMKKCFWDERGKVYLGSKGETVSGVRRGKGTVWWECIVGTRNYQRDCSINCVFSHGFPPFYVLSLILIKLPVI